MEMGDWEKEFGFKETEARHIRLGLIKGNSNYARFGETDFSRYNAYLNAVEQALDYSLDILVGPEYNFVPNKPFTVAGRDELFETLEGITQGHDTLVMPGTCFWEENGYLHNTMPILHNGELIATYDKMRDGGETYAAGVYGLTFKPGKEIGLFSYKDINIGVEICADHGYSVLKNAGINNLDLQIVSSCGMSLKSDSNATHLGGYQIITDGLYSEVDVLKNSSGYDDFSQESATNYIDLGHKLQLHLYDLELN